MERKLEEQKQWPARATRFPIPMPLQYRQPGEPVWHTGKVENISRTGILFRVEIPLGVNTGLEMSFQLPVKLASETPGHVQCTGQVVRTIMPSSTDMSPAIAAQILHYRLLPKGETEEE